MKATIATIVLLLAMVANAGPFGYEMGQKLRGKPNGSASDIGLSYKDMWNPPAPFKRVLAFYTEETGVCAVKGIIEIADHRHDRSGVEHRERADWLAGEIEAKYLGVMLLMDELNDDAFWTEPHYWLNSIRDKERRYSYYLFLPGEPDNILEIEVGVQYGFVYLQYNFANKRQCQTQLRDSL